MKLPRLLVIASVLGLLLLNTAAARAAELTIEAHAGKHDRHGAIVTFALPAELADAPRIAVQTVGGDGTLRSQISRVGEKAYLTWIIPGQFKASTTRQFKLKSIAPAKADPYVALDKTEEHLAVTLNGQLVLKYNMATVQPPAGTNKIFARSGYIHPVHTPAGLKVTNDFPEKHLHHHGIWFPWTETVFEGKKTDFWNMGKGEGTVEFAKLNAATGGDVFASFSVQHKHVALKTAKGRQDVLNETWDVRIYGTEKYHLIDLTSTQTCAGDSPLLLKSYHYGGLGVRGSGDWEGAGDACMFLTSEGLTRQEGHATAAKWCAMSGKISAGSGNDAKPAGIAILGHPSNFRFPQKMRIHPSEPFFNFAPEQDGDFEIVPGKPYVSRYRFFVFDGEPDKATCETMWADYAEPVEVKVLR